MLEKDLERDAPEELTNREEKQKYTLWTKSFVLASLLVLLLAILSLFTGVYDIFGQDDGWQMFFITRVPRTIALMLTGAAMSMSGLVMQLITQNRLVEATTSGTTEWGGLGLLVTYLIIPAPTLLQRMSGAIIFSFLGTMIFFLFLRKIRLRSSLIVPIIGMMLGAVVSAISTFAGLLFQKSQNIENWFVGSFAPVQRGRYEYLWLIILATIVIFRYADRLTIAGLGEDVASSLGLNYNKVVLVGTALVAFVTGIVSAVIGNLPFLGLIVPNIVTLYMGDHVRKNLPWVLLLGMGTITLCDILSRTLIMPYEVPVSTILGTVGSVLFIIIILRGRRKKA